MNTRKMIGFAFIENAKKCECEVTGKICYSKREAGEIINRLRRHINGDNLGRNKTLPRRSYYCVYCGCFHLTHIPFLKKSDIRRKLRFYESDY